MFTFHVEHLRRFDQRQSLAVRPITILVGENSSGKTSLLAALFAALRQRTIPFQFTFNNPPFEMGGYSSIATYKGGKFGRSPSFSIGFNLALNKQEHQWICEFRDVDGIPYPSHITIRSPTGSLSVRVDSGSSLKADISLNGISKSLSFDASQASRESISILDLCVRKLFTDDKGAPGKLAEMLLTTADGQRLVNPLRHVPTVLALAPIRTKPERTYNRLSDAPTPEGDHIPIILARLLGPKRLSDEASTIREQLIAFGSESGLFKDLKPRALGDSANDPFQLLVTTNGRPANLADVGYGVSQALPIAVQCLIAPPKQMLIVQQPEVHLHPRAQAALGSLFVRLSQSEKKSFVIETHSDYLIDRVRQHIKRGDIPVSEVSIGYVEMNGIVSTIHPIEVDSHGNITDAPPNYREFFLDEQFGLFY
ncbi:MAG: AAA family ATPase [Phycisphaeraceae bacterium]|nr:MAG: AAA family ATPase [Phycisphaeraceae bacterium]